MALEPKLKEELGKKLLEKKKAIENELLRFTQPANVPGDYTTKFEDIGTDPDENASEVEQYTDNLALENTLEKELKEINDALSRMDEGNYGICENCNEEIDPERLKAYPAAKMCVKCG